MPFEVKKNPKKWQLMGTGSGWDLAPKESDAIIMCLNDLVHREQYGVNYDILCIMDKLDEKPQVLSGRDNLGALVAKINASGKPFVAPFRYAEIPLSVAFPLEECVRKFGTAYFLNTIAYMVAYALLNGAEQIDIYGVNQASSSEFFYEKSSVEFWLGIAIGMGVKVTIHGEKSELLMTKTRFGGNLLYGYNTSFENYMRDQENFGPVVVHKLLVPPKPVSRSVRKIAKI